MKDIWESFVGTLDIQEDNMARALASFIKFLGFEDFEKSDVVNGGDFLTTEVYGVDDRRIFITVNDNNIGKYVITDNKCNVLDCISFKRENSYWVEVE